MELDSCDAAGAYNVEMASIFLKILRTLGITRNVTCTTVQKLATNHLNYATEQ
jgi:hypothetical protein